MVVKKLYYFSLRGRPISKLLVADPPDVSYGSPAIEHTYETIGLRTDAGEFVVGGVLQNIPHLPPKMLSIDLYA